MTLSQDVGIKMKVLASKLFMALVTVLMPLHPYILSIGFLIFIDLVFGLLKARKLNEPITSRRLKDTGVKLLIYQLLLISGFIIESYLINWIPFIKICCTFLAIIEFKSLSESFQIISGLPFTKFLKEQINKYLNTNQK